MWSKHSSATADNNTTSKKLQPIQVHSSEILIVVLYIGSKLFFTLFLKHNLNFFELSVIPIIW